MKKMERTNKMTKRIVALTLSFTMVFGLTLTAYAEETQETPEEITAVQGAENTADDAAGLIDAAEDEVVAIAELEVSDPVIVAALTEELNQADSCVDAAAANLENAENDMADAVKDSAACDTKADAAMGDVNNVNTYIGTYKATDKTTTGKANDAIDDALTANTTDDKIEAYNARDNAVMELADAEDGLVEATKAFNNAETAAKKASEALENAKKDQEAADKAVANAKTELAIAKGNSAAALAQLNAAKANAEMLEKKVQKYSDNVETLQAIEAQYHAMMVQYYRELNCEVFDENGKLDVDKSSQKALEKMVQSGDDTISAVDQKAVSPGTPVMQMSRYLMEQLVVYMLSADESVDATTIQFAKEADPVDSKNGESIANKEWAIGDVYTKKDKNLQNKECEFANYTTYGKKGTDTEDDAQVWVNVKNDNGRNNHVKVTYTDKDGQPQTKYYNYIFKNSSSYKDTMDVNNGPIYLAMIEKDPETGAWKNSEVVDDNNFDDYGKLVSAIEAIQDLEDYAKAKKAVDDAQAKVDELDKEIAKLENYKVDTTKIDKLKEELDKANADLAEAAKQKKVLEDKVEEARKAVAGIDLSRFNVKPSTPAEDDPEDDVPAGPSTPSSIIPSVTDPVVVTPIVSFVPATTAFAAPAATVAEAATAELTDGELPGAAVPEAVTNLGENLLPGAAEPTTTFTDGNLPGAQGVEDGASYWWLLWLLLLLVVIIAYTIYKYNENKKEEAAK